MKRTQMGWLMAAMMTLALGAAPAIAAPAAHKPVEAVKGQLPKGKDVQVVSAPNQRARLVFRDEGQSGDWPWQTLYVIQAGRQTRLGSFSELAQVRWSRDGQEVTAQVKAGTDYNKLTTYALRYRLGAKTYELKQLKVETVESSG